MDFEAAVHIYVFKIFYFVIFSWLYSIRGNVRVRARVSIRVSVRVRRNLKQQCTCTHLLKS